MKYVELKTTTQIAPSQGEDLGNVLAGCADNVSGKSPLTAAQMLYLAADAFDAGASASIGHNRSDRYEERARELRARADNLCAEVRKARDDNESAALLAAFDDGFAGRDIHHHSFDNREAALVGQLFAKAGRAMPQRINKVTPRAFGHSERDHLLVDGAKFVVDYPDGKVALATVTAL